MNLSELNKRVEEDFKAKRKSIFRSSFEILRGVSTKKGSSMTSGIGLSEESKAMMSMTTAT